MIIKRNHILVAVIVILSISTFMLSTFIKARAIADHVMRPISEQWGYLETRFVSWDQLSPSWVVRYDGYGLVLQPLEIRIGLLGHIKGTNPGNLIEKIRKENEDVEPRAAGYGAPRADPKR